MSIATTSTVLANIGNIIAGRSDILPDPDPRVYDYPGDHTPVDSNPFGYTDYFRAMGTPTTRVREMEYYDYLERNIPDVRKALDAFATMSVTGNLAGGGNATFTIKMRNEESSYPEPLKRRFKELERMIARHSHPVIRAMAQYGSFMPQLMVGIKDDNKLGVVNIKPIPPGTIFRNLGPKGQSDIDKYWVQIIDGRVQGGDGKPEAFATQMSDVGIPQWVLPHFAVWTNVVSATRTLVYGTSMLQPFGAIGLKVNACLDSLVVARLSRAAMRYIWKIDVSDIVRDQNAIMKRMGSWRRLLSRSTSLLNEATKTDSYERTPIPDADFFVPSAKDLGWDVGTIDGDSNLARVTDIELLFRVYFGALGVPPAYLGHQDSQGGRSSLSQIDIQFARTVRHLQMHGASGFEHTVLVDMLLGGYDPMKYPFDIVPPPIGARDDLLQAQIRSLQSQVIANLRSAGMDMTVNPKWILETFMNMNEEFDGIDDAEIGKLFEKLEELAGPGQSGKAPASTSKRIREMLLAHDGELMDLVRENFRLVSMSAVSADERTLYNQDQVSIRQLRTGIQRRSPGEVGNFVN